MSSKTKKAAEAGDPNVKPAEPVLTREERVQVLIEGYAHALQTNSPRTAAELAEMRELLSQRPVVERGPGSEEREDG